jgi:hypothetical protein
MPLMLALALAAQTMSPQITPMQPMPKGTGLPPPGTEEAAVMAPVDRFLAALAAHDATAMLAQTRPDGGVTVALERPDGARTVRHLDWAGFAATVKPGPERYEEVLTDPAVEVDGDIAMIWSPYVFKVDGKIVHCGTDHFDLVREGGAWKLVNITWSQRATGCTG